MTPFPEYPGHRPRHPASTMELFPLAAQIDRFVPTFRELGKSMFAIPLRANMSKLDQAGSFRTGAISCCLLRYACDSSHCKLMKCESKNNTSTVLKFYHEKN